LVNTEGEPISNYKISINDTIKGLSNINGLCQLKCTDEYNSFKVNSEEYIIKDSDNNVFEIMLRQDDTFSLYFNNEIYLVEKKGLRLILTRKQGKYSRIFKKRWL
jgi:hypothetical protein